MMSAIGICMGYGRATSLQHPLRRKRHRAAKATTIEMRIEFIGARSERSKKVFQN